MCLGWQLEYISLMVLFKMQTHDEMLKSFSKPCCSHPSGCCSWGRSSKKIYIPIFTATSAKSCLITYEHYICVGKKTKKYLLNPTWSLNITPADVLSLQWWWEKYKHYSHNSILDMLLIFFFLMYYSISLLYFSSVFIFI